MKDGCITLRRWVARAALLGVCWSGTLHSEFVQVGDNIWMQAGPLPMDSGRYAGECGVTWDIERLGADSFSVWAERGEIREYFGVTDGVGLNLWFPQIVDDFYQDIRINTFVDENCWEFSRQDAVWLGIDWQTVIEPWKWTAFDVDDALGEIDDVELPYYLELDMVNDWISGLPPIPSGDPRHERFESGDLRDLMPHEKMGAYFRSVELRNKAQAHIDRAWEHAGKIPDEVVKSALVATITAYGTTKNIPDQRAAIFLSLGAGAWHGGAAAVGEGYDAVKEVYKAHNLLGQADYLEQYIAGGVCIR